MRERKKTEMKKKYENVEMEIIQFQTEDVILTSNEGDPDDNF